LLTVSYHFLLPDVRTVIANHRISRFTRTACAQKLGFANADLLQETNWEKVKLNPRKAAPMLPKWVWSHDPEVYAEENFDKVLGGDKNLEENYPKGYEFEKWSIEQIMADKIAGRETVLGAGDWS
jgi:hypothetical protein